MIWETPITFSETVAVYYESGDYIVHNYRLNTWIVVNKADYSIVSKLQHARLTPNDVVSRFAEEQAVSPAEARKSVGRVLLRLWANRVAIHPGHPVKAPPSLDVQRTVPHVVYFVATYRCNLTCSYCYAESSPTVSAKGEMSTADAKRMIDEVAELGVKAMAFTGGEALLRHDCIELVEYAKSLGLQVHMITNGGPVTKEKAERLSRSLSSVTVSIDSATPGGGHDEMRGAGSWSKAERAVGLFQDNGMKVAVNTTVSGTTANQLPDMVSWALDRGITTHRIDFVSGLGRGKLSMSARKRERLRAERASFEIIVERLDEVDLESLSFLNVPVRPTILKLHCGVGVQEISIDTHGNVYPCKLLHEPQMKAGNIFQRPLREIWDSAPVFQEMMGLRPDTFPGCQPCTFRYVCGGTCRAHQKAMTGDIRGTFNQECPALRRSLRRYMWLHGKREQARAAEPPRAPATAAGAAGGNVRDNLVGST
jgi:radical SAM protein with 4Fe4S-binding SPASM domain